MGIAEFLTVDRVFLDLRLRDKAQLIAEVAKRFDATVPDLSAPAIEAALSAREQLGSTGLGRGFALPHARIDGLGRFLGLFVRAAKPVAFDAIDAQPVQLVFALLMPANETAAHVPALAAVSRRFRDQHMAGELRAARTPTDAIHLITGR